MNDCKRRAQASRKGYGIHEVFAPKIEVYAPTKRRREQTLAEIHKEFQTFIQRVEAKDGVVRVYY